MASSKGVANVRPTADPPQVASFFLPFSQKYDITTTAD